MYRYPSNLLVDYNNEIQLVEDSTFESLILLHKLAAMPSMMMSMGSDDYAGDATTTGVLPESQNTSGIIDFAGDIDWFAFTAVAGRTYRFSLDGTTMGDPLLGLYDSAGTLVYENDNAIGLNSEILHTFNQSGTFYLSAAGADASEVGGYTLRATQTIDDYSNNGGTRGIIDLKSPAVGIINRVGDSDWFEVNLLANETYTFTSSNSYYTDLTIRNYERDPLTPIVGDSEITFSPETDGKYYLEVFSVLEGSGGQNYSVTMTSSLLDDYAADASTTGQVNINGVTSGRFEAVDDVDWFRFSVQAFDSIDFLVFFLDIDIVDENGNLVVESSVFSGAHSLNHEFQEAGTYYLSAQYIYGDIGNYEITTNFSFDQLGSVDTTAQLSDGANGVVNSQGDDDWFSFSASAQQSLWFENDVLSAFEVSVYNDAGGLIETLSPYQDAGDFYDNNYTYYFDEVGDYFLSIKSVSANVGTNYETTSELYSDTVGHKPEDAGSIFLNGTAVGAIDFQGDKDWFEVELTAGQLVEITSFSADLDDIALRYSGSFIELLDQDGELVQTDGVYGRYSVLQSGTYYIQASVNLGTGIAYELSINELLRVITGTEGSETLNGSIGNDTINALGGNDTIYGAAGNDTINGGEGNDFLRGDAGDDVLNGGFGVDWLRGGAGADVLNGFAGADWADYITSSSAVTVNLLTNTATGGDAEGDTFSLVERVYGSRFDDHITGDAGLNYLRGYHGDDQLFGEAGDDYLQGGLGADALDGGDGTNDWAYYVSSAAGLTVNLGDSSLNTGEAIGDSYVNIENIAGSRHDDDISGDAANNFLRGFQGDDVLRGSGGNDFLRGEQGADVHDGGAGNDWAYYAASSAAVTIDLGANTASGGEAAGDSFVSIERVFGSRYADSITGDSGANYLRGYFGDDALNGGAGDDFLQGDGGADALDGGAGSDWAYYASATNGLVINLGDSSQNTGEAAGDSYTSIENVFGTKFDDVIMGDNGNNYLRGFGGDDIINGGAGANALRGEAGADVFVFNSTGGENYLVDWDDAEDMLDLTAFGYGSVEEALSISVQMGGGQILISFGGNGYYTNVIVATTIAELYDNLII